MIYVGIDVASEKHDYFMMQGETGQVFSRTSTTISNDSNGYKKLLKDISAFCGATGDSNVRIGLESPGIYHTNITTFLTSNDYKVMIINPILTNMARKAEKLHSQKTDNLDSQTICKYLIDHPDEFSPYAPSFYHNEELKSLSRKRFYIAEDLRKAKMALNNLLQIVFPEFKKLFSNIYTESPLDILKKYPTPEKLSRARVSTVAQMLHGRCKTSAESLISAACSSVGISNDLYAFQVLDAIKEIEHIQDRIDDYDARIRAYVDELCPNILTIPGVGATTAGLLIGEIQDIHRFRSVNQLISYAGIDIVVYESGKYKAQHLIPSKRGSKYFRYALFQASRIAWQCDPTFKAYYDKKANEGKHYYVILGHIQKKLLRVVFSIMKNNVPYQPISAASSCDQK